ncbi:MAG TPA: hypothetical protein VJ203_13870 [Bacteroidales bacterium]|nr:hypothetical protein [Bacteroidales bacterium]
MRITLSSLIIALMCFVSLACGTKNNQQTSTNDTIMKKLDDFAVFKLTTDINKLSENERKMIPLLIEAARIMDEIFWIEAYGDKNALLDSIGTDEERKLAMINYGPWERLNDNNPFIDGFGPKPAGANYYPADMTAKEFDELADPDKTGLYSLIRRNDQGGLVVVPYHVAFNDHVTKASALIEQAAMLAEDPGLKKYLTLRSKALLDDDYFISDMAWMDMKNNVIDFVVGPVETYEDQLYGYKASHEAYILIKDTEWSDKLARFSTLLPTLQKGLPVDAKYKTEMPGGSSDLGAYEVIYYAGDCNAGSKTIAINLPNDEKVQLARGSRRLQLKNAMQAKFDKILIPIAGELILPEHQKHITFDAFFSNTMFHEVAHGLGCINTINGKGTVREAIKEHYTTLEEGKADILGLYLETRLQEMGEIQVDLMNEYTTFLAGIFRSIRFGASSAHGKANLIRINYFKEKGAFAVDSTGKYSVNFDRMKEAIYSLSTLILTIQGDGDYNRAAQMVEQYGFMDDELKAALKRIEDKDIPVDIVFEQGLGALGL